MDEISLVIFGAFVGAFFTWTFGYFTRKQAELDRVVEAYVAEVRSTDSEEYRIAAMARSGVIGLSENEFKKFPTRVTNMGCIHPYKDSVIDGVIEERKIPTFLHCLIQENIPLADETEVYRYILEMLPEPEANKLYQANPAIMNTLSSLNLLSDLESTSRKKL